ncbi:MAG: hypothetical protein LBE97_02490 [Holosporales bacterium]|jgi:hypothetical protein|nr:hypothetical protein [Holosporales bacterium]
MITTNKRIVAMSLCAMFLIGAIEASTDTDPIRIDIGGSQSNPMYTVQWPNKTEHFGNGAISFTSASIVQDFPWVVYNRDSYFYNLFSQTVISEYKENPSNPNEVIHQAYDACSKEFTDFVLISQTLGDSRRIYCDIHALVDKGDGSKIPSVMEVFIRNYIEIPPDIQSRLNSRHEIRFLAGVLSYFSDQYDNASINLFHRLVTGSDLNKEEAIARIKDTHTEEAHWFIEGLVRETPILDPED